MAQATTRTIKEWLEPSKMPPIGFILERGYKISPEVADDTTQIFNRHMLTGDVETRAARQEFSTRIIMEMRAKLHAGANAMPAEPEDRRSWATSMAKKQGWL